jgi:4-hydroxy-2-oxoheptanedioate aldolase
MRPNRVKEKINQGKLAIGTYVNFADPAIVEIIGLAGFDAAFIDMEHSAFDLSLVQEMVRTCDLVGMTSLVRVPDNNPKTILRVLDMGAQGIQVPHISGKDDALRAINAVRYAPVGARGMGGQTRAAQYGAISKQEHVETSNAEILLAVMVEDVPAIKQLAAIAALDGLDLIAIGPSDLSQSLGVTEPDDPYLTQTILEISRLLKKVGKAKLSIPVNNPAFPRGVTELKRLGVAYANCGPSDAGRLLTSYRQQIETITNLL